MTANRIELTYFNNNLSRFFQPTNIPPTHHSLQVKFVSELRAWLQYNCRCVFPLSVSGLEKIRLYIALQATISVQRALVQVHCSFRADY
jgi:hypothetical protein